MSLTRLSRLPHLSHLSFLFPFLIYEMIPLPRFDRQGVLFLVLFCHRIAFARFLSLQLGSLSKNIDR